jgi:hypothetical protein
MYVHAVREVMLGMKLDMIGNRISFSPQLAPLESKDVIKFEHMVDGAACRGRLQVSVDPRNEKITVSLKDWQGRRPEFSADPPYGVSGG